MASRFKKVLRRLAGRAPFARPPAEGAAAGEPPAGFWPLPNWPRLLAQDWAAWQAAVEAASQGPPVLIATSHGGDAPSAIVESALAVALTLRGARVHLLLCDELLPACQLAMVHLLPAADLVQGGLKQSRCASCYGTAARMVDSLGLPLHRYGDFVAAEDRAWAGGLAAEIPFAEIAAFRSDGLALGEHALAGALRYFARGALVGEPQAEAVLRRYLEASLLAALVARRLLAAHPFASACFNHGIYVPQGIIGEVARAQGVPLVNWTQAYRSGCFIFTHHDTYHHALMDEPAANWEAVPWSEALDVEVMDYLRSRWLGTQDWIWFHEKPQFDLSAIVAELGVDFSRPTIGLLTNVMWDAQLHYRANAFPNMLDWVLRTIDYFAGRPDLQLVIRIHPAEVRGTLKSRQPLLPEIEAAFPVLPPNVFVIGPDSPISTYAVMHQCDSVIIYGTKTGVELTSAGIPVIAAGEAWIRNKGLTLDARSAEEYFRILDRLPLREPVAGEQLRRARKYAFHFFFRRMIPLAMFQPTGQAWPPYRVQISGLDDLRPGRSPGLDVVCEGILCGTEFVYPAEQYSGDRAD